jgi:hypothetical protein
MKYNVSLIKYSKNSMHHHDTLVPYVFTRLHIVKSSVHRYYNTYSATSFSFFVFLDVSNQIFKLIQAYTSDMIVLIKQQRILCVIVSIFFLHIHACNAQNVSRLECYNLMSLFDFYIVFICMFQA